MESLFFTSVEQKCKHTYNEQGQVQDLTCSKVHNDNYYVGPSGYAGWYPGPLATVTGTQ